MCLFIGNRDSSVRGNGGDCTTPTQPHRKSNKHRTKNNTTNVAIQQNSRKLLMMDILLSETCSAHKKWNKIASDIEAWNTDTTPTQPHRKSNKHRTKNNTTNVAIQQNSRKLLMMDILMSETCSAHKKWNKIASDIEACNTDTTPTHHTETPTHIEPRTIRPMW